MLAKAAALAAVSVFFFFYTAPARAQELPGDSTTMRRIAARTPCPSPVPTAWRVVDTTLGVGLRCSLVAAAAAAIQRNSGTGHVPRIDLSRIACVQLVGFAFRNVQTGKINDPYWSIEFYSANQPWVHVVIHRDTGRTEVLPSSDEFGFGVKGMCGR